MTQVTKIVVNNARGPRGFSSGPLGAGSVDAETVSDDSNEQIAILDKLGGASAADLASTASGKGAALLAWVQSGISAIARTLLSRLRDTVHVTDFLDQGDWGNGTIDDAPGIRACIAAHPGKTIYFPKPSVAYKLGSSLGEIPEGTTLKGAGRRLTKLVRAYSDTDYLMILGESAGLQDIWIDGDGASYTGGGVQCKLGTGRQVARDVRIINFAGGIPLHFPCTGATSAECSGSQSFWDNLEAWRVDSSAGLERYGVVHDDPGVSTAGHPIAFTHFNSSGYESIDFGACNNWHIVASNIFTFKTSDYGVGVSIVGGRISQGTGGAYDITLAGNGSMTGVHCFPHVVINNLSGGAWSFVGGYLNSGYTDNNPNSTTSVFDRTLKSYTPVWKGGSTDFTIGDGSTTGSWQRHGTNITFNVRLTIGSTTVIPAGSITVSLPDKCNAGISAQCMVSGHITRGGTIYKFQGRTVAGELVVRLERDTSGPITSTSPGTLASGDVIFVSGMYSR